MVSGYELCAAGIAFHFEGKLPGQEVEGFNHIDRGQLVTSRGQLSEETGLSEMQIRTAIDKLDNCGFITKSGTRKYTIITVCNYDLYQQAQDGFDNGCQPTDNQQITSEQPTDNQQITTTKEYKKERIEEYTHTLVDTKKGVVGGKEAEAAELIRWITTNAPCIASMPEPLTEVQIVWLFQDYSVKDIRRLIATMQSKQAYLKHTNAYTAFAQSTRKWTKLWREIIHQIRNQDGNVIHEMRLWHISDSNAWPDRLKITLRWSRSTVSICGNLK